MRRYLSTVKDVVVTKSKSKDDSNLRDREWTWEKYRIRSKTSRRTTFARLRILEHLFTSLRDWISWRKDTRNLLKFLLCRFSIIETILSYKPSYFVHDVLAGVTLSFFHLSQGLAYGGLAGLSGANGIYVSLYAPFIYALFGTSRHISIGTFAVMALLIEQSIENIQQRLPPEIRNVTGEGAQFILREQIAESLCFYCGIVMISMAILHFGALVVFLTKAFVGGYLCAAAFFVFTRQISACFGITVPHTTGFGLFFKRWVRTFRNLKNTNLVSLGITLLCLAFLWIGKTLNQRFIKYVKIMFPFEVLCIALACIVGSRSNVFQKNNVTLIGELPTKLNFPEVPNLRLGRYMLNEVFTIVFITLAGNYAGLLNFSDLFGYEISTHQDLLAYGITNLFCSFFRCFPACASLSRTVIARNNLQQTQFASIVSSLMLLIMVYTITKYLSTLPNAVLAGFVIYNIVTAMKRIVMLKYFWYVDFAEGCMWLTSFLSVLLFDLDKGLIVSIVITITLNTLFMIRPTIKTLGKLADGGFVDVVRNPEAYEVRGVKIIRIESPLLNYNARYFKQVILEQIGLEKSHSSPGIAQILGLIFKPDDQTFYFGANISPIVDIKALVLDCSAMTRIDSVGIQVLKEVKQILEMNSGAQLRFVGVTECVVASIDADGSYDELLYGQMYHEINEAISQRKPSFSMLAV